MKKLILISGLLTAFLFSKNLLAADCARLTGPYADGDILYANDYENENNNIVSCINSRVQDTGDTMTGNLVMSSADVRVQGGNDFKGYSDSGSNVYINLDGATGNIIGAQSQAGEVFNCSISNSGTTFTISSYDGTALSASNPCMIAVRSNTSGRTAIARFTSNVTFTHGAASETDGNNWGITSSADWANAMPFFLGVIYDGTTPYFTIGRLPRATAGSASTDLCQKGDTDCDAQDDVMILTTGLTLSSWVSLPITQVGWFTMTYATASSAWTAVVDTTTGFNDSYKLGSFVFSTGQNGAISGYHINNSTGANNPTWATSSSITYRYKINSEGVVKIQYTTTAAGNATNGGVANQINLYIPYIYKITTSNSLRRPIGEYILAGAGGVLIGEASDGISYIPLATTALANVAANSFTNAGDDLMVEIDYRALSL